EIEESLRRKDVLVVPLLVSNARLPRADELPESLVDLAYRNVAQARPDPDFHKDMSRLILQLGMYFSKLNLSLEADSTAQKFPKSIKQISSLQLPTIFQQNAFTWPVALASERLALFAKSKPKLSAFEFETVRINAIGKIVSRQLGEAKYLQEDLGNGVILDMVAIPGGEFLMGSPEGEVGEIDETPQHQVRVSNFFMGKYTVTQAQYQEVVGQNPSKFLGKNRPVEQVSWKAAIAFCEALSQRTGREYRVPTEAEWEYACRAGTTTPFHFGETITPDLANYASGRRYKSGPKGKYRGETTDVGSFSPNAFGLYDMHGNVCEWCIWYGNYEDTPKKYFTFSPLNELSKRVKRGGSWLNNPWYCRSSYRDKDSRDFVSYTGFRLVCSIARA
ncbi:hypothetical protein C7271_11030, partial [filamentous cyanobacterium CCP5]